jgi:hypothetical protein
MVFGLVQGIVSSPRKRGEEASIGGKREAMRPKPAPRDFPPCSRLIFGKPSGQVQLGSDEAVFFGNSAVFRGIGRPSDRSFALWEVPGSRKIWVAGSLMAARAE